MSLQLFYRGGEYPSSGLNLSSKAFVCEAEVLVQAMQKAYRESSIRLRRYKAFQGFGHSFL